MSYIRTICNAVIIIKFDNDNKVLTILAIKKCIWEYSQLTPIQRKRWINEVDIMKRLKHPNIVKTEYIPSNILSLDEKLPILCMEYCQKGDLRKVFNISCVVYEFYNFYT